MNAAPDGGCFLAETKREAAVADPFTKDAGCLVERWLGLVLGHDVQPQSARAESARAQRTRVLHPCAHADPESLYSNCLRQHGVAVTDVTLKIGAIVQHDARAGLPLPTIVSNLKTYQGQSQDAATAETICASQVMMN
jgi:hypothetical protein